MRRRASSSAEDEDGAIIRNASEYRRGEKSEGTAKEANRTTAKSGATAQERKTSRGSTASDSRPSTSWPRTSISESVVEKDSLDESVKNKETAESMRAHSYREQHARLQGPWSCTMLTLTTTVGSILLLLLIMQSFLTLQLDPKGCAMSYMAPSFAHFSDFDTEHTRFASKYSLYLYREGGVDQDTRVKGIPVLFIPGNAGSYKQMRPIAAEAAHYFQDVLREDPAAIESGKRPLDFFTVDFNEEMTAFHGQTLLDQAEYLNEAVAYILALYHNPHRSLRESGLPDPKSVIILGHSMGGIVARTMLRMPNYQEKSINTIFTLSAPHARAPVSFDPDMVSVYNDINTFWRESYSAPTKKNPLSDLILVSVAGGGLDTMIPSEYSSLTSVVPDTHGFTVFTSAIPTVWTGMDHLAIMWCDQFRKALVKAMFDVIDVKSPSQTLERRSRIRALRKRLLTGMEPVVEKALLDQEPTTFLSMSQSTSSVMSHGERLTLSLLGEPNSVKAHIMPMPHGPVVEGSKFTLLTDQVLGKANDSRIAVLLCSVFPPPPGSQINSLAVNLGIASEPAGSTRLSCKNAATDVSLLPASTFESMNAFDNHRPFSYLQYELSDIEDYQFVAVVDQADEEVSGWLIAEFSTALENKNVVSMGHHELLLAGLSVRLPAGRPLMTEIRIPEVHSTLFAYRLSVTHDADKEIHQTFAPLLRQYIQEPYESKYFVNVRDGNINVHGISPYMPPPLSGGGASEGLSLQLWSDPAAKSAVEVSLQVDLLGSAGKLVMRYRTVLAAFPLLVVAIVIRKQFKIYDTTGVFMSFSQSMDQCIRTSLPAIFTALTFLAIALSKASHAPWTRSWFSHSTGIAENEIDFTLNDLMLGTSDPFFWFLVPLFGVISVGLCIAANYIVLTITHIFAFIFDCVRTWTLGAEYYRRTLNSFAISTVNQRIVTTGVLVLLLITFIPYQLAYIVLCVVQLSTAVRALRLARDIPSGMNSGFYNYIHSMLLLMLGILPLNTLALIVWAHNLAVHWLTPFSAHQNVMSVLPYILLVEVMSTGSMIPRVKTRARFITNIILFAFALYAPVYGVTYAYRLHHMVNALCAWFFLIHITSSSSVHPIKPNGSAPSPAPRKTSFFSPALDERRKKSDPDPHALTPPRTGSIAPQGHAANGHADKRGNGHVKKPP
ncbi:Hypothetical protein R9X50_00059000 [Acrodontium crateriforme]|uniref:GPI inositol-deacylase n=1 Tax=Acrodontium crateriforme TaxID=150365 RepID=A0AAQ3R7A2_9PEZI|nr:Hypothetical protein R9X50_00059000 [Acrodontium crateriforme]